MSKYLFTGAFLCILCSSVNAQDWLHQNSFAPAVTPVEVVDVITPHIQQGINYTSSGCCGCCCCCPVDVPAVLIPSVTSIAEIVCHAVECEDVTNMYDKRKCYELREYKTTREALEATDRSSALIARMDQTNAIHAQRLLDEIIAMNDFGHGAIRATSDGATFAMAEGCRIAFEVGKPGTTSEIEVIFPVTVAVGRNGKKTRIRIYSDGQLSFPAEGDAASTGSPLARVLGKGGLAVRFEPTESPRNKQLTRLANNAESAAWQASIYRDIVATRVGAEFSTKPVSFEMLKLHRGPRPPILTRVGASLMNCQPTGVPSSDSEPPGLTTHENQ